MDNREVVKSLKMNFERADCNEQQDYALLRISIVLVLNKKDPQVFTCKSFFNFRQNFQSSS